MQIIILLLKI